MKSTIDYSQSPCPSFDAMQDVMDYFGDRWKIITKEMAKIKDQKQFAFCAAFAGIEGFPVIAWYEHYHGQGSWEKLDTEKTFC